MIQASTERPTGRGPLALGFLLAALLVAILLAAKPAHADTLTVTNTNDPGDGVCNSRCTLREAINEANDNPGADTINFNIPGSGVKTISPESPLPTVAERVTINGYTQSGAKVNTLADGTNAVLKIEINGENAGDSASGLRIQASDSVVRGLVINRFDGIGIEVGSSGDAIDPRDNRVVGNFIGTDPSGTLDRGNEGRGVVVFGEGTSNNTIGGFRPAARNVISGNDGGGVGIFSSAANNGIRGNLIGTEKDGATALNNVGSGVRIDGGASDNTVGGDSAVGGANTIAFNAFNGANGVTVDNGTGNSILRNSIFSNGDLGIDLGADGVTPNDPGDGDTGPNDLQNYPVLSSAENSGGKTTIKGDLNSESDETFTVRFFSNPPDTDQGKKFIGQKSVTTNLNGNVSFSFKPDNKVPAGQNITATATDPDGNTSEFSNSLEVS